MQDSDTQNKKESENLEESKISTTKFLKKNKGGKAFGMNIKDKFRNDYEDIEESATIDFNLTETGSMADSLVMPLGGISVKKHISESAKERQAKIDRLIKGKDPFSSYVPEHPEEDEDEISEEFK